MIIWINIIKIIHSLKYAAESTNETTGPIICTRMNGNVKAIIFRDGSASGNIPSLWEKKSFADANVRAKTLMGMLMFWAIAVRKLKCFDIQIPSFNREVWITIIALNKLFYRI